MTDSSVPLCLDLEGVLTPVNLLHERLLSAAKQSPAMLRQLLWRERRGKGPGEFQARAQIDIASLPFRTEVLHWLRAQREIGRRLVLVADGDRQLAVQIAAHLDLFDEIADADGGGSSAERKRRVLIARFGEHGFDFVGSDASDRIVWAASRRALVVGDRSLSEQISQSAEVERVFQVDRPTLKTWIKAIRLHQWVKNGLIFLPALLAHQISNAAVLLDALVGFLAFGCCASSVYLINDLLDLTADRQHPRKRRRPLAAGLLSARAGSNVALLLLAAAALLSVTLGMAFAAVLGGYYLLTWGYSLRLKRVTLLDVMTLAGLYTLRIIAGAAATKIELSFWLLAFSVFIFLSLGFVKRYAELNDARKTGTLIGHSRGYGVDDLPLIMTLGTASGYCAVVVMALYINSVDSSALYRHHKALWLICPVMLFWISRVWMLTVRGHMHDDPVVFALRDRPSLLILGALGLIVLVSV
jgi:4-hydroxybenzoate polyprenyltransferase